MDDVVYHMFSHGGGTPQFVISHGGGTHGGGGISTGCVYPFLPMFLSDFMFSRVEKHPIFYVGNMWMENPHLRAN